MVNQTIQLTGINLITRTPGAHDVLDRRSRKARLIVTVLSVATIALAVFFSVGLAIVSSSVKTLKSQHAQLLTAEASYAQVAALLALIKQRLKTIRVVNAERTTWNNVFPIISAGGSPVITSVSASEKKDIVFQVKTDTLDEARTIIDDLRNAMVALGVRSVVLESFLLFADGTSRFMLSFRL